MKTKNKVERNIKRRKGIALALSGGGAKGLAHIGVFKVLDKAKIPIKTIAGTSMGALIGGIYAAGKLKDFEDKILKTRKLDVFKIFAKPSFKGIKHGGVKVLLEKFIDKTMIEELPIKYGAVVLDLRSGKTKILKKGNLILAILGAISIPYLFKPLKYDKQLLVDAGNFAPVPVKEAKSLAPTTYPHPAIAVDIKSPKRKSSDNPNVIDVVKKILSLVTAKNKKLELKKADKIIEIEIPIGSFQYQKATLAIKKGEEAAKAALSEIKCLLKKD